MSLPLSTATAIAHPNIAFIKYWGDVDPTLHIPANGSISMNLDNLLTRTMVNFDPTLKADAFYLNDTALHGNALERVSIFLDRVRRMARITCFARVESWNNFPSGAGIASSASGFAALSLAATQAAGLELDERSLSRLARTGSGSACRSVPGGFVAWQAGHDDEDSFAYSIAPPEYWAIVDCIAVVSQEEKQVSSAVGHSLAHTSSLQKGRVEGAPERLSNCRHAIMKRDFNLFAQIVELDSDLMHTVMLTSTPSLQYWQDVTFKIVDKVIEWRSGGLPVCSTVDAGPNVHVICPAENASLVSGRLSQVDGVQEVIVAHPGGPAKLE